MTITLDTTITIPTANNAITCRNEYVLWQSAQRTGNDVQLAGVHGALARPRYMTTTVHTLELVISGRVRVTGTPTTAAANLEANVEYLRETICGTVSGATGTRAISVSMPSGTPLTGNVHVLNFRFGQVAPHAKWALATVDISIPGGELT